MQAPRLKFLMSLVTMYTDERYEVPPSFETSLVKIRHHYMCGILLGVVYMDFTLLTSGLQSDSIDV